MHAADARYHESCRKTFMNMRKISNPNSLQAVEDTVFDTVVLNMERDKSKVWTSIEIQRHYLDLGGTITSRWLFMKNLKEYFGERLLVLSSPGIADILVFKEAASNMFNIEESDEMIVDTNAVAREIVK